MPLGQAEAARAIGLPFAGVMRQVVLPQAFRASVPPVASALIALLKNTSVAAVFGVARGRRPDEDHDQQPRRRALGIFFAFAISYVILVEMVSLVADHARAPMEDRLMAAGVLFDAPGPKTVARHRIYTIVSVVVILALVAWP